MTPGLDENKIFIVGRGETDLRLDVPFHKPSLVRYLDRLAAHSAGLATIRQIADRVVDGPFGTQLKVEEYVEKGIPLLRVSDVRTGNILKNGLVYISPEKQEELARSRVLPNDVILTKAGAILGYSAVFPEELIEGNITSHLVLIRCKSNIIPQFLSYYLRSELGQKQIYRWGNKATRPELNTQEVKRILVPLVDFSTQQRVIETMKIGEARYAKLRKTAKHLQASIDKYLLDELGILLPTKPENTIENRISSILFRELMGNRFDPFFNNRPSIELQQHLVVSGAVKLHSLVQLVTKGETPLWRGDDYQQVGIPFLRAQNISPDGLIGNILKIDENVDNRMARSKLFGGEVLYTMAGTIGVACIYPECYGRANINQAIAKIVLKPNNEYLKDYIVEILNSSICRCQAQRALTVAAQPNINFDQIKSILIPLPNNEVVLERIVEKCKSLRYQAQQLREQAATELSQAKQQIESMLLGEANL